VEPGFGAALAGRVRAQGVAGWFKGAGRGSRRACPGKGAARITAGDFGRDWRGRVGREGPDMGAGLSAALEQWAREVCGAWAREAGR